MKVVWSRRAQSDLGRIMLFNLERSPEWAMRVDTRLRDRGESLGLQPRSGRPLATLNVRSLSVPDIQYVITYRLTDDEVTIFRVESTREDRSGT